MKGGQRTTNLRRPKRRNTQEQRLFDKGKEERDRSEWLTTEEAATVLRVSVGSLRNMTSNGRISAYKLGRRNRYLRKELDELLFSSKEGVRK
jgi:excisionase family DNA binding protein